MRWRRTIACAAIALLTAWSSMAHAQDNTPRYVITDDVVEVAPGTTMYYLVRDFYPNHRNDWLRVARDLAEANPQAFRNGDPGALIVGKEIRLIDYGDGVATVNAPDTSAPPSASTTADPPAAGPDVTAAAADDAPIEATPKPASTLTRIGQISLIRGAPSAFDLNNRRRSLEANATIYRGDTLLTGKDDRVSALMDDGAVLRVRGDTRITLEKYRVDAARPDDNGSVLTLVRGGVRLTTGNLAEQPDGVLINTAVATLTTSGGDLAVRICATDECQALSSTLPAALYCGVALGEIVVSNNTGSVSAVRGQALRVRNADAPAQLAPAALGVVFDSGELTDLDLQSDEPLGFWAWFRQRFFSFGSNASDDSSGT
jgi:hypothetical protein